ncbi:helix-turn-helix domain-containing protein [Paenibacillus sp. FSL K6-1096]|uniref:AraC family transcriptional regulator n=1 Tax=Paenibacillus sp. FSL K6-1096 TaxID=2921460 RepID=UPI0030EEE316
MNYSREIGRSIEYIEEHLRENLTAEQIAAHAGYSLYHFCRMFSQVQSMPVMEYVRSRRLSLAAVDLFHGRRITDIALEYGFETPGGFAKAFRKTYGYSPSQYAVRMNGYVRDRLEYDIREYIAEPVLVTRPAFNVAGYGIETDVEAGHATQDVASFWYHYEGDNLEDQMYAKLNPPRHGEVGLCIPADAGGNAVYLLGVIVDDFNLVTSDMLTAVVPAAQYAVFTTPPVDATDTARPETFAEVVKSTWRYIFEDWFPGSGYVHDEGKLNFEFYDERCHARVDSVMEIYVPVRGRGFHESVK